MHGNQDIFAMPLAETFNASYNIRTSRLGRLDISAATVNASK
jgi:hypothetical protein